MAAAAFLVAVVVPPRFRAVFAALAALATPRFAGAGGLLGGAAEAAVLVALAVVVLFVVAARVPRFGLTIVVPLDAVEMSVLVLWLLAWLTVLCCGLLGADGAGRGGGSMAPLAEVAVVVVALSFDAVRLRRAVAPRFACSYMPCTLAETAVAAVLSGEAGLRGDVGRAIMLPLTGEVLTGYSLIGERGRVRELWDLGERTDVAFVFVGLVVVAAVLVRFVFFWTGSVS